MQLKRWLQLSSHVGPVVMEERRCLLKYASPRCCGERFKPTNHIVVWEKASNHCDNYWTREVAHIMPTSLPNNSASRVRQSVRKWILLVHQLRDWWIEMRALAYGLPTTPCPTCFRGAIFRNRQYSGWTRYISTGSRTSVRGKVFTRIREHGFAVPGF